MIIIHTADWHLRDKDVDEAEKCLAALIETATDRFADLIVIAGDIFDSQEVKLDSKAAKLAVRTVSALADICPVAIVIGTSSHDGMAPSVLANVRGRFPVKVAATPEQVFLYNLSFRDVMPADSEPQAVITLIPQPTKQFFQTQSGIVESDKEIGEAMSALFAGFGARAAAYPDVPHILIGHWNVAGSILSNGQTLVGMDIEIGNDQMALANPTLTCLGHIHKAQQIGLSTFYSGSLHHLNWGELETKGYWEHNIAGQNLVESIFRETPARKLARFRFDLTAGEVIDVPFDGIAGADVRIDVTVWQDEAGMVDKTSIADNLARWGAQSVDVRLIRVPRQNVRSEAVLKVERLREKIEKMAELKGVEISASVLAKAVDLEAHTADELVSIVGGNHEDTKVAA